MSRIIVLTASRASEFKERILRARRIDGLTERECLSLDNVLRKVGRGAGARISGKQLASLVDLEAKGNARIYGP